MIAKLAIRTRLIAAVAMASLWLAPVIARAEYLPKPVSNEVLEQQEASPKRWSLEAYASYQSNLFDPSDEGDYSSEADFRLTPAYRLTDKLTVAARLMVTQNFEHFQDTLFGDVLAKVTYGPLPIPRTSIDYIPGVSMWAPSSYKSWHDDGLYTALNLPQRLDLVPARFGHGWWESFDVSYTFTPTAYFYKFEKARDGTSNPMYGISDSLTVGYKLFRRLELAFWGKYDSAWTYDGNVTNGFFLNEELSVDVQKWLNLAVGHTNNGNAFKDNGSDSNIALFNSYSSTLYVSATVSL